MIPVATALGLAVAAVISIGLGTLLALANAPADLNDVCPDEVEPCYPRCGMGPCPHFPTAT